MIVPARLMLLRAVMVVDRVEHAVAGNRRRPQQQRGLAAVSADLQADPKIEVAQRGVVQGAALVGRHEAGNPVGELEQSAGLLGGLRARGGH